MADRVDYDHELGNGWKDPWQQLILTGMKEQQSKLDKLSDGLQDIKVLQALAAQQQATMKESLLALGSREDDQDKQIGELKSFKDRATGMLAFLSLVILPAIVPVIINFMGAAI